MGNLQCGNIKNHTKAYRKQGWLLNNKGVRMSKEDVVGIIQNSIRNDDFIKLAYNDWEVANLLWNTDPKKYICSVIFHLQQSSEKLVKVYVVMFHELLKNATIILMGPSLVSEHKIEKEIKEHDAFKILSLLRTYHNAVFKELNLEKDQFDLADIILKDAGIIETSIDYEKGLDDGKNRNKIATMDKKLLLNLIKTAKENKEKLEKIKLGDVGYEILQNKLLKMDRNSRSIVERDSYSKAQKFGMDSKNYFKTILDEFSPLIYSSICVFTYALILYPHEQAVRYPIGNNVELAPINYTNNGELGISSDDVIKELISDIKGIFTELKIII